MLSPKSGAVEAVHRAYIEAGATALKTNSFGEHALEIAPAAWEIACRAAAGRALVFADIGPQACREALTQRFLDLGAQHFLFETFPDASALALARLVKERAPHAYVIASFAADPPATPARANPCGNCCARRTIANLWTRWGSTACAGRTTCSR